MSFALEPAETRRFRAFSLLELLLVVAIIGILAGLLLTAVGRAQATGRGMACRNNLRQLGIAFLIYLQDSQDVFPTAAPRSALGPQPEDWVWWQLESSPGGTPAMRDARQGSIVKHLGNYDARYFRCPADRDALSREIAWRSNPGNELYTYSYSLNAHTERGMASYISKDRSVIFRNKHSAIHKPAQKIMLAEEKGGPSDGIGSASIDDGRWIPPGYPLTERHGRRGHVTFADGHIEAVPRGFADSEHPEHYAPEL